MFNMRIQSITVFGVAAAMAARSLLQFLTLIAAASRDPCGSTISTDRRAGTRAPDRHTVPDFSEMQWVSTFDYQGPQLGLRCFASALADCRSAKTPAVVLLVQPQELPSRRCQIRELGAWATYPQKTIP